MLDPTIVSFIAIGTTIIGVATSAVLAARHSALRGAWNQALADECKTLDLLDKAEADRDAAREAHGKAVSELIAANVELTAYRAAEKRRQDQRVAASRSGHAKRAEARAAANGAA